MQKYCKITTLLDTDLAKKFYNMTRIKILEWIGFKFIVNYNSKEIHRVNYLTNTTSFNLVYAGTGFHQVNYCNISYCNANDNRFYAGTNSTDGWNNTGWKFRSYLAQNTQIL